jgi:hypothetical protein
MHTSKRTILLNKIKKRFKCCISRECTKSHMTDITSIRYDNYNEPDDTIILSQDFVGFENDINLYTYLVSLNGFWLQFASIELQLNRILILTAIKKTPEAICIIPTRCAPEHIDMFQKIWEY